MAYADLCGAWGVTCTRVLYWSNPGVSYAGAPTGIAGGTRTDCIPGHPTNTDCDADNHRVLNNTAYTVANFRLAPEIYEPVVITRHPVSQTVVEGTTVTFSAAATGIPAPSVKWNCLPVSGQCDYFGLGQLSVTVTATMARNGTKYWAEFQNNLIGPVYTNKATLTVLPPFSDDPIQPGVTVLKAAHITELRQRIAALRARYGLSAYTFSDATLYPGATFASSAHIQQLRVALADVYIAAGRASPTYTDPILFAGQTPIKAVHVAELRAAVLGIE